MFERYTTTGFSSYEDFVKNFKINAPDDFNFAYDVMDVLAEEKPEKLALLWTNLEGDVRRFTFADLKRLTDKAANFFYSQGDVYKRQQELRGMEVFLWEKLRSDPCGAAAEIKIVQEICLPGRIWAAYGKAEVKNGSIQKDDG